MSFLFQILFVQIDTADDSSSRVTEFFGIEDDNVPTCRIINLEGDMKKFVPDFEGLDMDNVRKFVNDYLDGKLKVGGVLTTWRWVEMMGVVFDSGLRVL